MELHKRVAMRLGVALTVVETVNDPVHVMLAALMGVDDLATEELAARACRRYGLGDAGRLVSWLWSLEPERRSELITELIETRDMGSIRRALEEEHNA